MISTHTNFGNGRDHDFEFQHNLGTENVDVIGYEQSGQQVLLNAIPVTDQSVRVTFWAAPKSGDMTVEVRAL